MPSNQPSLLLSSLSPPAFNLSQHQGLFQGVSSSHQGAKVLPMNIQDLFPLGLTATVGSACSPRDSQDFPPMPKFKSISSLRDAIPAELLPVPAAAAKSLQSFLTLCYPIDGLLPGSSVPGILQARTLEWVAISFSNAWKWKMKVKSLSHVWLCHPMDRSLPGFSIHGIFQARVLEWGAIAFSASSP